MSMGQRSAWAERWIWILGPSPAAQAQGGRNGTENLLRAEYPGLVGSKWSKFEIQNEFKFKHFSSAAIGRQKNWPNPVEGI